MGQFFLKTVYTVADISTRERESGQVNKYSKNIRIPLYNGFYLKGEKRKPRPPETLN